MQGYARSTIKKFLPIQNVDSIYLSNSCAFNICSYGHHGIESIRNYI